MLPFLLAIQSILHSASRLHLARPRRLHPAALCPLRRRQEALSTLLSTLLATNTDRRASAAWWAQGSSPRCTVCEESGDTQPSSASWSVSVHKSSVWSPLVSPLTGYKVRKWPLHAVVLEDGNGTRQAAAAQASPQPRADLGASDRPPSSQTRPKSPRGASEVLGGRPHEDPGSLSCRKGFKPETAELLLRVRFRCHPVRWRPRPSRKICSLSPILVWEYG